MDAKEKNPLLTVEIIILYPDLTDLNLGCSRR
jgi:hypothetical protein